MISVVTLVVISWVGSSEGTHMEWFRDMRSCRLAAAQSSGEVVLANCYAEVWNADKVGPSLHMEDML